MKLLEYINQKTNNAYKDFKLVSVIFDEKLRELTFKFLYKDTIKEDDKDNLFNLVSEYIDSDVKIIIKCKKAYIDTDLVRDVIYNFIFKHFASVGVDFEKKNINVEITDQIFVKIDCNEFQYNYLSSPTVSKEITNYADGFFFEPFSLSFELNGVSKLVEANNDIELSLLNTLYQGDNDSKLKFNKVKDIKNYIGEVSGSPLQISCIKEPMQNVEIAGTIHYLTERSFESKRKDKNGEQVIKTYYAFSLVDKTGKFNCVLFPTKSDLPKAVSLQDNTNVILHGDVEEFNGRMNFKVKSLAFCDFVVEEEIEIEVPIQKEPNKEYICVIPEPHVEMFQDNLFAQKDEIGQYLLDNDVVVFDIETTGLEASRCEILEIGAVKLHKGKITETFETLIRPNVPIPEEITELTGINDDMVADAPSIKQVMPDFYKFCYGTTIMAYNIDFDYKFISLHGKKLGFVFDMKQIDAMFLARAYIPGLKNFKLSSVCKKLGVSLENAHRAVHDAMATAEVVIKLSPNIT